MVFGGCGMIGPYITIQCKIIKQRWYNKWRIKKLIPVMLFNIHNIKSITYDSNFLEIRIEDYGILRKGDIIFIHIENLKWICEVK